MHHVHLKSQHNIINIMPSEKVVFVYTLLQRLVWSSGECIRVDPKSRMASILRHDLSARRALPMTKAKDR